MGKILRVTPNRRRNFPPASLAPQFEYGGPMPLPFLGARVLLAPAATIWRTRPPNLRNPKPRTRYGIGMRAKE